MANIDYQYPYQSVFPGTIVIFILITAWHITMSALSDIYLGECCYPLHMKDFDTGTNSRSTLK